MRIRYIIKAEGTVS
jgi:hypothetical protein